MSSFANVVLLAALVMGCSTERTPGKPADAPPGPSATTVQNPRPDTSANYLITPVAMGPLRLGMTLGEARIAIPSASFYRTSDGDGVALVTIALGGGAEVVAWAGEDASDAPIEWSNPIERIETFDSTFRTSGGVRVGLLVDGAASILGPLVEIVLTEIESRQFIRFANQSDGMTLRLDYSGIFAPGENRTMRYESTAKIFSIAISTIR